MAQLITTVGLQTADELGLILPHEHVFVDLRTPDRPGYAEAGTEACSPRISVLRFTYNLRNLRGGV